MMWTLVARLTLLGIALARSVRQRLLHFFPQPTCISLTNEAAPGDTEPRPTERLGVEHSIDVVNLFPNRFLNTLGHDLRTLIHGVLGMLDLLFNSSIFNTPLDDQQRQYA